LRRGPRHLIVQLAALLVESHPEPPLLVEDVADVQVAGRGDAGEGEDHDAGQGAIPQPNHVSPTFGAQQVAEPGARMAVREHAD